MPWFESSPAAQLLCVLREPSSPLWAFVCLSPLCGVTKGDLKPLATLKHSGLGSSSLLCCGPPHRPLPSLTWPVQKGQGRRGWGKSLFCCCQYHLCKGQAVFPPRRAASLVPNVCPAADDRPWAPSNSGQKVTLDVPGCLALEHPPPEKGKKKKKSGGLNGARACVHLWAGLHLRPPATSPSPKRELHMSRRNSR